jgi:hypothetical protein
MDSAPPPEAEAEPEEEKPGFWSTLEPQARRFAVVVAVVALVIGLVGGFAAGFKVEQNRIKTNAKKAKVSAAGNTKNKPKAAKSKKITRIAGPVTAASGDTIAVRDTTGFSVKVPTPSTVVVTKTTKGSAADIKVGSAILQRGKHIKPGVNQPSEIVVLSNGSKVNGLKVTGVDGQKVTVLGLNKKPFTLEVQPTTVVYTLSPGSIGDVKTGGEVLAEGTGVLGQGTFAAKGIIILPPGSRFATEK